MSTTLTIRNLDEGVKSKLRVRAALHQRSMEAEARDILARGVESFDTSKPDERKTRKRFLDLAGSVEGEPGLSAKRGFER